MIDDAVTAYKGTEIDILYGVVMDHAVMGGIGGGGWLTPTFLELTYSENQVGHSENYGSNSITKF